MYLITLPHNINIINNNNLYNIIFYNYIIFLCCVFILHCIQYPTTTLYSTLFMQKNSKSHLQHFRVLFFVEVLQSCTMSKLCIVKYSCFTCSVFPLFKYMCQIYMCTMLSVHTVNVLLYVIFCECVACKDFFPNYIQRTVLILLYIICCVSNVHVV